MMQIPTFTRSPAMANALLPGPVVRGAANVPLMITAACAGVLFGAFLCMLFAFLRQRKRMKTLCETISLHQTMHAGEPNGVTGIDAVTGLMTRAAFEREMTHFLRGKRPAAACGALIMLDVDDLKRTNDTFGHILGDQLLRNVGAAILQSFRNEDVIGRFGGDEFMVLIPHVPSKAMLLSRLSQLTTNLHASNLPDGQAVTCSVGAVAVRGGDKDFEPLYQLVDEALYAAKHAGKDRCTVRWEN